MRGRIVLAVCVVALLAPVTLAQSENECDPGEFPDVLVGDIHQLRRWGTTTDKTAYSIGTTSCNGGTCWLNWFANTADHPVIGGNMFRLMDGRFEQLGQSWLKHGFFALSQDLCSQNCVETNGTHLGVNCSDPYSSFLNGDQPGLGPKWEVNASTGVFPYPATDINATGGVLYKRLQVDNTDLEPALNPGAEYFVEAQYVARDDAEAIKHGDNASFRKVWILNANLDLSFTNPGNVFETSSTIRQRPALYAWRLEQPSITFEQFYIDGDGFIAVASDATDNGDGTWSYEFAVQNLNSHRSVGSFSVPLPFGANVTNIGFHDVDYHSGNPYDGTDWQGAVDGDRVVWSTTPFAEDENANALRWGTLYNFRFDADVAPAMATVELGLWRPGTPESVSAGARTPALCNLDGQCDPGETCANCPSDCADQGGQGGCCGDGTCDGGETPCSCFADCGPAPTLEFVCDDGIDGDCDGRADCLDPDCCSDLACGGPDGDGDGFEQCDCNDADGDVWAEPGEVDALVLSHDVSLGETAISWSPPLQPGGSSVTYEVLRSANAKNFVGSTTCVSLPDAAVPATTELDLPDGGEAWFYLVRAENSCSGEGGLGRTSQSLVRAGRACP